MQHIYGPRQLENQMWTFQCGRELFMSQEHKTTSQRIEGRQRSNPKMNYENTTCLFLETVMPFQQGRNARSGLRVAQAGDIRTDPMPTGQFPCSVLQ